MSIKLKLLIGIAIIIFLSAVIGLFIVSSNEKVYNAFEQSQKAERLVREVFWLNDEMNEYLLYHEDRTKDQWEIQYKNIRNLLSLQRYDDPNDQVILKRIIETHSGTSNIFSQLVQAYQNGAPDVYQNRLTSQLLVNTQSMVTNSETLSEKSYQESVKIQIYSRYLIEIAIGLLILLIIVFSYIFYRSIVGPIAKLRYGTHLVAGGNLDFKVDIKSKDEIGQLTADFNNMTSKLNGLERMRSEFIGIVSHELKTPVTSLKIYLQVLKEKFAKSDDKKTERLFLRMDTQLNKLASLISDLLDVTKIEAGKLQFNNDYFDFNELVNEIIEELKWTTNDHTIIKKLSKSQRLYGDRERIGQVLTNLLSNAIKYSPDRKKIIVKTQHTRRGVMTSITDFGFGIPKEKQQYLFEKFFRVSDKNTATFPGMGLGLYICAEIIKRHHGKIWVESKEEKGATFYFEIPIKNPSISTKVGRK